jgi:hypothetical protein
MRIENIDQGLTVTSRLDSSIDPLSHISTPIHTNLHHSCTLLFTLRIASVYRLITKY